MTSALRGRYLSHYHDAIATTPIATSPTQRNDCHHSQHHHHHHHHHQHHTTTGMCTWIDHSLQWRVAPLVHYRTTAQGEGAQGLEWVEIARRLADAGLLDQSESTVAPEDRAADINSGFLHMAADGALAADRHSAGRASRSVDGQHGEGARHEATRCGSRHGALHTE